MIRRLSLTRRVALVATIPILAVTVAGILALAGLEASHRSDAAQQQLRRSAEGIERRIAGGEAVEDALFNPPAADLVAMLGEGRIVRSHGPVPDPIPDLGLGLLEPFKNSTDGRRYVGITVDGESGGLLAVLSPTTGEVLRAKLFKFLAGGAAFALLLVLAVAVSAKGALRRVDQLRSEVADLGPAHSMVELTVPATGDELERLAITLNDMIQRLRDEATRLDAFADDTAHELRSPLASIQSNLEVLTLMPESDDRKEALRRATVEVDRSIRLVDSLLTVAKLEHERQDHNATCEIGPVLDRLIEHYEYSNPRLSIDTTDVDPACYADRSLTLAVEPEHLYSIVDNLLDNSSRYAETTVSVRIERVGNLAVICVADDGPGIPEGSRHAIFERFHTAGGSRRFGLGLPLARRLTERANGTLSILDSGPLKGTTFQVSLPIRHR